MHNERFIHATQICIKICVKQSLQQHAILCVKGIVNPEMLSFLCMHPFNTKDVSSLNVASLFLDDCARKYTSVLVSSINILQKSFFVCPQVGVEESDNDSMDNALISISDGSELGDREGFSPCIQTKMVGFPALHGTFSNCCHQRYILKNGHLIYGECNNRKCSHQYPIRKFIKLLHQRPQT